MARIEELVSSYKAHVSAPWLRNLAGPQKTIFVVYPKMDERRLRARPGTKEANVHADCRLAALRPCGLQRISLNPLPI